MPLVTGAVTLGGGGEGGGGGSRNIFAYERF